MCVCVCVYPRWGDSPVALQPCCVPDLGFDGEVVQLNGPCAELDADGGATVVIELILSESRQQVALSNARLPYQNHLTDGREESDFILYKHNNHRAFYWLCNGTLSPTI